MIVHENLVEIGLAFLILFVGFIATAVIVSRSNNRRDILALACVVMLIATLTSFTLFYHSTTTYEISYQEDMQKHKDVITSFSCSQMNEHLLGYAKLSNDTSDKRYNYEYYEVIQWLNFKYLTECKP